MTNKSQYDVFLCHNSKEKEQVQKIREQLRHKGILAWLDKYDFEPFRRWQEQLEEIIPQIEVVAVFIGSSGVGPWADIEMKEFLVEFAKRKIRMGLVILPGCPQELVDTVPRFMKGFHWVDFRQADPNPMEQLIWGITGKNPEEKSTDRLSDGLLNDLTSNQPKMPDSVKLLEYLKKLNNAQFNEVIFLLEEKELIDKSHLSFPVAPTTSAIEVINLLKQRSDGLTQLESILK